MAIKGDTTDLEAVGLGAAKTVHWHLSPARLYEEAIRQGTGKIAQGGPLVVDTTPYTGRSPNDKFIVRDDETGPHIAWGKVNRPIDAEVYDRLLARVQQHLVKGELFVRDVFGGNDPTYRLPVRVITESAWSALFAQNMFVRITSDDELRAFQPEFTIIHAPSFLADPATDGTNSEAFVLLNMARKQVLIGGTKYCGEIKKSVFSILNYLLPMRGVMAMHCSANVGADGDVALFFGLSGTGKTTLSADPDRPLIGDDEHGWSDDGTFNFEGGCYAKVVRLNRDHEPEIFATTERFGTVLENVVMDPDTRGVDLDDDSKTENTRAAYPITHLPNIVAGGCAGHPSNVIFLTADAFGVLPPISHLTPEQAMYYFLSGYTAKVAGTERGVKEPQATFSACFGEPFLPLHPNAYAKMLGEKIRTHGPKVWLINTGWTAGPYGVGHRIAIPHTRSMIRAVLEDKVPTDQMTAHPVFRISFPGVVPGVPDEVLDPRATWSDPAAYDRQAAKLAQMFRDNFERYGDEVSAEIRAAAPTV